MVRRELGGTEWTDQQGNSKCSDAWKVHKFPVHEVAILSGYFEATKTSDANKLKEWDGKCGGKAKLPATWLSLHGRRTRR